jgi:hypothetical protein
MCALVLMNNCVDFREITQLKQRQERLLENEKEGKTMADYIQALEYVNTIRYCNFCVLSPT